MKSIPLLHFNIRDKLVIALLLLASIPLLIVGTYGVYYSIKTLEDSTLHYLEYEVSAKAQDVEKFLKNVHNDVLFLSQSGGIKAIVDYKGHPRSNDFNSIKNKVGNEFLAFATVRPYYYQIRYLNKGGHEIIRVDSDGKSFWIVPPEKLQFKGDRYYFTEAIKYNKGKCYVSPMDLNIEWGKIEVPHKPVVRVATPVFDGAGKKRGVVIINIFASYFIQQMQMTSIAKGGSTYLVNKEGFYLSRLNSQTSDSGFVLGSTDGLGKDFPKEIAAKILSGKKGTIKDPSRIISYGPIFTGDEISGDYWILVLEYPKMAIFTAVSKLRMVYIVIGIISMLASVAIGIWMAQRLTKPILELHKGAEWIADGDFEHKLDIRTGDEIEGLARQFNSMADNLKESRERILKWNEELRQEVEKRTHELEVSHRDLLVEKNKLASILMCAKEGIIVADEQDRVIILNPAAETMLGVKEGDVLGKSIFTCHKDPHNVARMLKELNRIPPASVTAVIGSNIFDISVASININDKRLGSMMVMRDITERQKLIDAQIQMEKQLYQADKMASIGELSTGIAHEIGNPLASIKTVIQAMEDDCPLRGGQRRYLTRILKEVDRLTSFIRVFSAFAHPSIKEYNGTCRIEDVLKDCLFLIRKEAAKHSITIHEMIEKGIPEVGIGPQQMQQIFINLLLNAIQSMPNGGNIRITVGYDNTRYEIPLQTNTNSVKLSISDTGCGISQKDIDKIFNPFFTTKPTGTGLGLSIVHKIVTEHSGRITVSSAVDRGTTFAILLPVGKQI